MPIAPDQPERIAPAQAPFPSEAGRAVPPDAGPATPSLLPSLFPNPLSCDPDLHRSSSKLKLDAGDRLGSAAHAVAADVFEGLSPLTRSRSALPLYNVATGYLMTGDLAIAADWYQLALSLDPELVIAHQNLAAVYQRLGDLERAEHHRREAYRRQRVFVEPCAQASHRVLVLCTGQEGNIPFEALLPAQRTHRIKYFIEYASRAEDAALPDYDLVFNAVGEPDRAQPLFARIEAFARTCGKPILNPPEAIVMTSRERLPALLAGIPDVLVAPCVRLGSTPPKGALLAQLLAQAGITFPLLARPVATHGGEGVVLHGNADSLSLALGKAQCAHYACSFVETRSADGYYRKYRMIFVDRKPYPYHAAISQDWLVHYFSADMQTLAWKIEEEKLFLEEPAHVLGSRALAALEAIGLRLDLDFGGIDFTLLPDGRIMVFEANATMLVHYERPEGHLGHKNTPVAKIVAAFDAMQDARLGAAVQAAQPILDESAS